MSVKNRDRINRQSFGDAQPDYNRSGYPAPRDSRRSSQHGAQPPSGQYRETRGSPLRGSRDGS